MAAREYDSRQNRQPSHAGKFWKEVLGWVAPVAVALAVAIFLTQVILINAQIPTPSMEPGISPADRVLGLRTSYWFAEPKRGDVIVFRYPDNEKEFYIKRVIGLPGDNVKIEDGKVYINHAQAPLQESYLAEEAVNSYGPYTVPDDCYFVMGDNRNVSWDSRFWENTFVKREQIIGEAWVRIFPNPKLIK